ncbi:hypothetical protein GK047_06870 [Paenibacillus sp. SYP-B3998]|uniref:Hemerythrin-like domain-containing protein n=1 Tax=Paenibacillus sp. SYP-B3998 TaxID=2678564 RepID=A0A6G3ZUJ7_9BACL|nr:hemerythrin domain-containing protein [Paenibacillus sp. SYP-B3998]NEW05740.1 hypothetical protein [Paenibacillus sp. SYP-B3998]
MMIEVGRSVQAEQASNVKGIIQRLKDEHDLLKQELDEVQRKTCHMFAQLGTEESTCLLGDVRRQMALFLEQLELHEHWEEEEVLPILHQYANQVMESSFVTSKWVMQEDHKQAERFVRSFLDSADACQETDMLKLQKAVSLLSVACSVLTEHLLTEEDTFFPIADQILSDIQTK